MLSLTVALLLQMEPLDKGLEAAKKENKPLVVFFHRHDWQGADKIGAALKGAVGDLAAKLAFSHANVEENPGLLERYDMKKEDGGVALLDPHDTDFKRQPLVRYEESKATPEGIKKAVEEGLKSWTDRSAVRAAVNATWGALKKKDLVAFTKSLWKTRADFDPKAWLAEGVSNYEAADHIDITTLGAVELTDLLKQKYLEGIELAFDVRADVVGKDGGIQGTRFTVFKTKAGSFVAWGD